MWRHGETMQGKTRWYCPVCKQSGIRKRNDVTQKKVARLVRAWIIDGKKLKHCAKDFGLHPQYVQHLIHTHLKTLHVPHHHRMLDRHKPLILDATWIVWRKLVVLIAHNGDHVMDWVFAQTENYVVWSTFLARFTGMPRGIVSDAQKGLLQATHMRFGSIPHQRCIAHITRQCRIWLTRHPKTEAGVQLLPLVNMLYKITTPEEKESWSMLFDAWLATHEQFLKERTRGSGKQWWYTHRKLRGVRSLLVRARTDMFTYLHCDLPSTTNHLEGGINGPLKFVFKEHRGLSEEHKKQVVNLFLNERAQKKNQH
jgi:hypothetical protein